MSTNQSQQAPHPADSAASVIASLSRDAATLRLGVRKGDYLDAAPFVILRDAEGNESVHTLRATQAPPHRKSGTVKLKDADSFISYYAMHGNGAPVYATLQPARFVAVLNDHTKGAAGFRDHRAEFTVAYSKEWETWTKHSGAGASFGSNEAFALFLEEHAPDIVKPDPAKMLEVALNFRLQAEVVFSTAQRLQDGTIDFGYSNVNTATSKDSGGKKLAIPEMFSLSVPVFDGIDAPRYPVDARFRYRLRDSKLSLWYELVRPHKVVEKAFKDVWEKIAADTNAPILHGDPG